MTADPSAVPESTSALLPSATAWTGTGAAQLLACARDGVVAADAQGCVTEWNRGAERMLGWLRCEAIGQPLAALIVPVQTAAVEGAGLASWIAGGFDGLLEIDVVHRDGRPVTLELSGFALPTPAGQALGLFVRDVSQRHSTQAALHQSEERYRAVVEHLSEGMIVIQDEKVVYANPRAAEIARMPLAQMQQIGFLTRIHPDDQAFVLDRQRRRLAGERPPDHYELRLLMPGGEVRWIAIGVSVVPWGGQPAALTFFSDVTDRKRIREALHHSEERYRAVVEHAGEGMAVVQDGVFVFVNRRALQITRRARSELIGHGYLEQVHPEDRAMMAERQRRRIAGEAVPNAYELRLLHADGRVIWIEVGATLVPWDGKRATLAFFSDVSQRKALEARLRETLVERETILENSLVGIAFLTQTRKLRWANRAIARIFRTDRPQRFGAHGATVDFESLFSARADYVRARADIAAQMRAHLAFEGELQLRRHDGTLFWAAVTGKAVNASDAAHGTVWTIMDITERQELAVALQRTLSEREAIFASVLVGIAFNVKHHMRWVNDKFVEMMGYSREELAGQPWRLLYPDDESYAREGELTLQHMQHDGTYTSERQLIRKNGERIWVQLAGRCVFGKEPDAGVIWTSLDITARRRAEDEVRAALVHQQELNVLRSRFVTMTSHEFRTPLATILSSADLMRHYGDRLSEAARLEVLDGVEAGVQRMTRMLDRILLIGKADAQMLEFRPVLLDLRALCQRCVGDARRQYPARADDIALDFQGPQGTGLLDEKLLHHVLGNLLSNAVKYSPAGGAVRLRVTHEGAAWVLEVSDEGIGIPVHEQRHLFEAFHRASNVGDIPGTGLGLAIVKKAVDVHGGTIEVCSVAERGSCFKVRLGMPAALTP